MISDVQIEDLIRKRDFLKEELVQINANNELYFRYKKEFNDASAEFGMLAKAEQELTRLDMILTKFATEFQCSRRDMIEDRCEEILDYIFPEEHFGVKIDTELTRGKMRANILLGRTHIPVEDWHVPKTSNGGFVQQLIVASIIYTICEKLGADFMLMDEQFCSSDYANAQAASEIFLQNLNKVQKVIIEHKPELYSSLDKVLIKLHKDRSKGFITSVDYV